MKVHVLQHVAFEGIGSMEAWLLERGATISYTRFFEEWTLPDTEDLDLIIAMGGPMSVNDEAELSWLIAEKQFVREAIQWGVPVLGICLGAQLIASALGARVYAGPEKEIGWFEIEATPSGAEVFRFPPKATVFHWHGETFDLPQGAVQLAKSSLCANQAFQVGRNVIGLQFHLETTPQSAEAIITHCGHELIEAAHVQSKAAIRTVQPETYTRIHQMMADVLAYLTQD